MTMDMIHNLAELTELAVEWNMLLKNSASDVPFLRFEYLTAWWKTLGGGEWPEGELNIVVERDEKGKLLGAAPLFFTTNCDGLPALMFLGSIEISDYLDFVTPQEHLPVFINHLFDLLARQAGWQVLDLYNFMDHSASLKILEQEARQRGWIFEKEFLQHCPYIELPGDFEKYMSEQVDKKQRHEIRRKIRRFESSDQPVRWYIVQDRASLEQEIEEFLKLMAYDPDKERFLTAAMRSHMKTSLQAIFDAGWLQLAFLEVGGQKAAGYLNFDYNNHIWIYNSGLNFDLRELSPGWVLVGYLLQWANEQKRAYFDFMRGDEEYKYRFGAKDRRVVRVKIQR